MQDLAVGVPTNHTTMKTLISASFGNIIVSDAVQVFPRPLTLTPDNVVIPLDGVEGAQFSLPIPSIQHKTKIDGGALRPMKVEMPNMSMIYSNIRTRTETSPGVFIMTHNQAPLRRMTLSYGLGDIPGLVTGEWVLTGQFWAITRDEAKARGWLMGDTLEKTAYPVIESDLLFPTYIKTLKGGEIGKPEIGISNVEGTIVATTKRRRRIRL